jgi:hypothetical protein
MSTQRKRLLFIAPAMPDSGGNGLAMRQAQCLTAYARNFDVDLAVIPLAGPADADSRYASRLVQRLSIFPLTHADTHFSLLMRIADPQARLAAFTVYGRPSIAARITADLRARLAAWLDGQNYALVHIGRLYLLGAAPAAGPCIVDADEDDARVFRQMADAARRGAALHQADWLTAEAENTARMAAALLPVVRHVFTASQPDAAALAPLNGNITVIPNTVARPRLVAAPPARCRVLFVGTLNYAPNADAVSWFISQCWHRLRRHVPDLRFDIVGSGAAPELQRLMSQPGIIWHGRQPDLARFYARARVVLVPVRMGGGSRIKLLEAAAYGRAISATTAGAEGCGLLAKRDFACADNRAGFVAAVMYAMRHHKRLARAARRAVARGHDPAVWQARILEIADIVASSDAL